MFSVRTPPLRSPLVMLRPGDRRGSPIRLIHHMQTHPLRGDLLPQPAGRYLILPPRQLGDGAQL